MIGIWFKEDIERILAEHRYIVVTDANGEGEFLLKTLPQEIKQIPVKDECSEIEAKYLAESKYRDEKVVFYARKKADDLSFLQEYVQTAGMLVLDDMEAYIRLKLFAALGKNTSLSHDKLLLAAKLSEGKTLKWWQSVADGITEPLRLEDWLLDFLHSPSSTKQRMDDTVWNVFRTEVYRVIGKTPTEQPAETMAQEVVNVLLQSLIDNSIDGLLLDVYYQWADSTEKADVLKRYVENYALPTDIDPLKVHANHPFAELDRKVMKMLSEALKLQKDATSIVAFIKTRTSSKKAKLFKPTWLNSVLTLSTFSIKGLNNVTDYNQMSEFYLQNFAKLDTAMRKIYVAWLSDEPILRPLQEHYTQLNNELLSKWYSIGYKYTPNQQGIVAKALASTKRTAIIVCDGLRLEIAESIVDGNLGKNVKLTKNTALSVLPSVTENGMSALFGCEEPTTNRQERFNKLKESYSDVEIMELDKLNEGTIAHRLVLNYGDIDQVGEKKQLSGLKDIDNYETELREKIQMLFRLGYEKVVITTDHGFVITGILDEADKEPRPNGHIQKIEERYVLAENPLPPSNLIEVEGKYFDSNYQYYAPTDKPFVTRGAYGYAHGGFTPQECIIPAYELTMDQGDFALGVMISNKKELKNVAGNYFTVKLLAEGSQDDLFTQERKIKVMLFAGSTLVNGNMIYSIKPGEAINMEYELTNGIDKVVIADKNTAAQIDSCEIKKSSSRDIDDLF